MKNISIRQVTLALLATTALITANASAAEFTVSTPTAVQNGGAGNILDGNDSLTILSSGSVTVSGDAVSTTGDSNTIVNAGSITSSGFGGYGISINGNNGTITNSGSISKTGTHGGAVSFFDGITFNNSGSVSTTDLFADAVNGFNNNTINNSGSISTSGQAVAIQLRDNNTINNSGSVSTSDTFSNAIFVRDGNTVNNSGTVSTTNNNSNAIVGQNNNSLNNTGTITTTGISSAGMAGLNNNTITNSGTVSISGENAIGISLLGINNTALNSGTINVNGLNSYGMAAAGINNTITNSGSIVHNNVGAAMGAWPGGNNLVLNNSGTIITNNEAHGIIALDDSTINNTGSILTKGMQGRGIIAGIGNTIINSGKIIAEQTDAILFTGSDNQLTLNAPSFIGGRINMGNTNAVDVVTGRSHSVLWDFSTHGANFNSSFSGPVPWAWDPATEQFATLDPTALSAAPDLLANMVSTLSDLTRIERADDWWLQGYGNFSSTPAAGIYNDYTSLNGGIATGASFVLNENTDLGAFVGYQASSLNVNSRWVTSQTINSNGVIGGIYGTTRMNNVFLDFALYAGWSANNSDRFVNDNLQTLGEDHALASFNSWFLSPEARVGVNIDASDTWTLTPSATARFSNQWINGYTETGTNANASVGARQVQIFEGELELAATRDIQNGSFGLRGGVQFRQALGAATQDITLLGQTLAMPLDTASSLAGYVGVDASYNINPTSALSLSAKASYGANSSYNIAGSVGFNSQF